jgi:uridine phosphorylase
MIQPHILTQRKDIAANVLLPGDPGRAQYIAKKFLDTPKFIAQNREFVTYTGMYKGIPITVTSTGIGCPSTAIAVEELINCGAQTLIRVGTCGGALKKDITPGSIIIPTASIREEGTTKEYIPAEFPAVADYKIVSALADAAQQRKYRFRVGINRTHDAFYGQAKNIKAWGSPYLDPRMSSWAYPLLSSEMESSALFIISMMRGVQAGAVLAVNSYPEPLKEIVQGKKSFVTPKTNIETDEAKKSIDRTIITALTAIKMMKKGGEK